MINFITPRDEILNFPLIVAITSFANEFVEMGLCLLEKTRVFTGKD